MAKEELLSDTNTVPSECPALLATSRSPGAAAYASGDEPDTERSSLCAMAGKAGRFNELDDLLSILGS